MADKKKKKSEKKVAVKKSPRQDSLPGLEDRALKSLENAALDYDDIKKQRMALTEQEVPAKALVMRLMHAAGKTDYVHGRIEIHLVVEEENVKVKVHEGDITPKAEKADKAEKPAKKSKKAKASVLPDEIPNAPAPVEAGEAAEG
jgi:hypothetical protein